MRNLVYVFQQTSWPLGVHGEAALSGIVVFNPGKRLCEFRLFIAARILTWCEVAGNAFPFGPRFAGALQLRWIVESPENLSIGGHHIVALGDLNEFNELLPCIGIIEISAGATAIKWIFMVGCSIALIEVIEILLAAQKNTPKN